MEIKINKNKSKVQIKVTVPADEMTKLFDEAYNALAPSVNLPGFRPGKAPRAMNIESIGMQRLSNAAIQEAVRKSYLKAITDNKLNPLGNPNISIVKQPSFIEGSDNTLEYTAEIDTLPEVKFTKDYKKIKLSPIPEKKIEVSDKEVEDALGMMAKRKAAFKARTGGAQKGDKVEITFQGYDGKIAIEQLQSKNHPIILGSNILIPGFEEKLIGMRKGEKKSFSLAFPKDYHAKQFAGKKYKFDVTVENVEEVIPPKIDDKFAKDLGAKSLSDLKKLLKENLIQEKKNLGRQKQEDEIVTELAKMTRADLPEVLVASEKERLQKVVEEMATRQNITFDEYLKNIKTTKEKFDEDIARQAGKNVLIGLALRKIAQDEKIELGKEDSLTKVVHWLIEQNQIKN